MHVIIVPEEIGRLDGVGEESDGNAFDFGLVDGVLGALALINLEC